MSRDIAIITKERFTDLVAEAMWLVNKGIYGCSAPFERPVEVGAMAEVTAVLGSLIFGAAPDDEGERE